MTHAHLPPTFALDRTTLTHAHEDPDALGRLVEHVGGAFHGVAVLAVLGAVSS